MRVTPFNTGKVLIGCNYTPPAKRWIPSRTEDMLQSALLNGKNSSYVFNPIEALRRAIKNFTYREHHEH